MDLVESTNYKFTSFVLYPNILLNTRTLPVYIPPLQRKTNFHLRTKEWEILLYIILRPYVYTFLKKKEAERHNILNIILVVVLHVFPRIISH
jgi:hypothetical protein